MQDSSYPMPPPPPLAPPPVPSAMPSANPYAAPAAVYSAVPGSFADAERIRHELVRHEAWVKVIGFLYLLAGSGMSIAALGMLMVGTVGQASASEGTGMIFAMVLFSVLVAALYFWIGFGLRRLDRKVRIAAILLAAIGLLGFPLGTLINAYFLYLLASDKGRRVLSPEYQQVVAATPHIRCKSPLLVVILVVLLLLIAIGVFVSLANS